jgi:hypothetical protein
MDLKEWLDTQAARAAGVRAEMLEQLAAAYLLKTNIPPDECILVEEAVGAKMTWRFERKPAIHDGKP